MHAIRFDSPELSFTAYHGIQYENGMWEPLHEHRFRVVATIAGPLNAFGYVADFVAVAKILKDILLTLEGKILLSEKEAEIRTKFTQKETVEIYCAPHKKWTKGLPERSDESPETARVEFDAPVQIFRGEQYICWKSDRNNQDHLDNTKNCMILPIRNTTAELLATWIGDQLLVQLAKMLHLSCDDVKKPFNSLPEHVCKSTNSHVLEEQNLLFSEYQISIELEESPGAWGIYTVAQS